MMANGKKILAILALLAVIAVPGVAVYASADFPERGAWHGRVYENEQLGFVVILPDGWSVVVDEEVLEELLWEMVNSEDTWEPICSADMRNEMLAFYPSGNMSVQIVYYRPTPEHRNITAETTALNLMENWGTSFGSDIDFVGIARIGGLYWLVADTGYCELSPFYGRSFITAQDGFLKYILFKDSFGTEYFDEMLAMFINFDGTVPEIVPLECELAPELVGAWAWDADASFVYNFYSDGTGRRGGGYFDTDTFTWVTNGNYILIILDEEPFLFDVPRELWAFIVIDNILTLASRQSEDRVFSYIRVPESQELSPGFPERGTWRGNIYTNVPLGFSITLPEDWLGMRDADDLDRSLRHMSDRAEDIWDEPWDLPLWRNEMAALHEDFDRVLQMQIMYYRLPPEHANSTPVSDVLGFAADWQGQHGYNSLGFLGMARIGDFDWFVYDLTSAVTDRGVLYARRFSNLHEGVLRQIIFRGEEYFGTEHFDEMLSMFVNLDGTAPEIIPLEFEHARELVGTWTWDGDADFVYNFYSDGTGRRGGGDYDIETFTWLTRGSCVLLILDGEPLLFGVPRELWAFAVSGDTLTLDSRQADGLRFLYILD